MFNCVCIEANTKDLKELFLSLPQKLYDKKFLTQNIKVERQILNKTHPLSKDFDIYPFIVLTKSGNVISRCILTVYPNDENGYVGFFESVYSSDAVGCMIEMVKKKAKDLGIVKLIVHFYFSFLIKYIFKLDNFHNIYTGEPYNKEYYQELWEKEGFVVSDEYYSNQLRIPVSEDDSGKCKKRLEYVIDKGYDIRNVSKKTFDKDLKEIFRLLSKLYSGFPVFKMISEEQFITLYGYFKHILDYRTVFLAFKDEKLVGFLICLPNFKNNNSLWNVLKTRRKAKEYIVLYLGVDNGHLGLGGAFAELSRKFFEVHKNTSVLALIHRGNMSGAYYKNLIVDKYNYVLMSLDL